MDASFVAAHYHLSEAYARKGMYAEAIAATREAVRLSEYPLYQAQLGRLSALTGRRDEAQRVLAELQALSGKRHVSPFFLAVVYAGLGERDQAFAELEKAYQERFRLLAFLKVAALWDGLRADPRWQALLSRMNFPEP